MKGSNIPVKVNAGHVYEHTAYDSKVVGLIIKMDKRIFEMTEDLFQMFANIRRLYDIARAGEQKGNNVITCNYDIGCYCSNIHVNITKQETVKKLEE